MNRYQVRLHLSGYVTYTIDADSEAQARDIAFDLWGDDHRPDDDQVTPDTQEPLVTLVTEHVEKATDA